MKRIPHVYVVLFALMVLAGILTHVVTPGEFERETINGREVVVEGSFRTVEADPVGFWGLFQSVHIGMLEAADIIFYIFIVGGAFGILRATGAVEGGVGSVVRAASGREKWIIPVVMVFFSLVGAVMGMAEETLPYIAIMVPLMLALGFDSITGAAVVLVGAGAGFTAAFLNPFTVGVAQQIAHVPPFSGWELRVGLWVVFTTAAIGFVMRYASRIKRNPAVSPMNEQDQKQWKTGDWNNLGRMTIRHGWILGILLLTLVGLGVGVNQFDWFITEIAGLFLLMGIVIGLAGGLSVNQIADSFIKGCRMLVEGALVVGLARAILVVMEQGSILDPMLAGMAVAIGQAPSVFAAVGMYFIQCLLNFVVPSGSGQAGLTMPVMAPLADLLGVSRQTAVLAFQLGDGISNIISPTSGYFMAGLALAQIPWNKWARWILPLILIQYGLGAVFVTLAHLAGY